MTHDFNEIALRTKDEHDNHQVRFTRPARKRLLRVYENWGRPAASDAPSARCLLWAVPKFNHGGATVSATGIRWNGERLGSFSLAHLGCVNFDLGGEAGCVAFEAIGNLQNNVAKSIAWPSPSIYSCVIESGNEEVTMKSRFVSITCRSPQKFGIPGRSSQLWNASAAVFDG
nr:hypothetical protein CFP56_22129 [Quercus suber]